MYLDVNLKLDIEMVWKIISWIFFRPLNFINIRFPSSLK